MFSPKASTGFSLSSAKGFFAASSEIQSRNSFRVEGAAKNRLNIPTVLSGINAIGQVNNSPTFYSSSSQSGVISNEHPFQHFTFRITGRLTSATRDMYAFSVSSNGGSSVYVSSMDLVKAGYSVIAGNDCSVKLVYKTTEFFVTCVDSFARPIEFQPLNMAKS